MGLKFSVVVPVYNTEKYLDACIDSVLCQDYRDFELLLINDGSTDGSIEICQKRAKEDKRIQVFNKENSGQIETRSYGVSKSSGSFIVFLDSDDLLAQNALSTIYQKIEMYDCEMVVYSYVRFSDDLKPVVNIAESPAQLITNKKNLYKKILFDEKYNSLCIKAIKRNLFNKTDYAELKQVRYGEDLLQTIDIIKQNPRTVFIDDNLYYYRTNYTSVTHSLRLDRYVSDIILVRETAYRCICVENFFSPEELYEYKGYSIKLLAEGIANIARTDCSLFCKKVFFNYIKGSKYYQEFILHGKFNKNYLGNKRVIWFLFTKKCYLLLTLCFKCKKIIKGKNRR